MKPIASTFIILFLILQCSAQPIGTIVAWSGNPANIDPAWKICDGTQIAYNQYPDLCNVIGDYWGPITGNNHDLYTLPNLLGMFLRGVNQGRSDGFKDPNCNTRTNSSGVNLNPTLSNQVGSYQHDAFQGHWHGYIDNGIINLAQPGADGVGFQVNNVYNNKNLDPRNDVYGTADPIADKSSNGTPRTSSDTRPNNAYVYWIIKVKN